MNHLFWFLNNLSLYRIINKKIYTILIINFSSLYILQYINLDEYLLGAITIK
jgi:hypothetical protein